MCEKVEHIAFLQIFFESISNLNISGRRSLLALLGIMVGSGSIIALLIIGGSAADEAMRTFRNMGTDTLIVTSPFDGKNRHQLPAHIPESVRLAP